MQSLEFEVPEVPKVKELRVIFEKTGFIKACPPLPTFWDMPASVHDRRGRRASKINQVKKHSQRKVENSDRFLYLDLRKSRLQAGLDKYLVLEPFTLSPGALTVFPGHSQENPIRPWGPMGEKADPVPGRYSVIDVYHPSITKNGLYFFRRNGKSASKVMCSAPLSGNIPLQGIWQSLLIHIALEKAKYANSNSWSFSRFHHNYPPPTGGKSPMRSSPCSS